MRKNYTGSVIATLLFALLAIYFLIPSFKLYSLPPEQQQVLINQDPKLRKKIINLGLDLQGGMRIVLQVDRSKLKNPDDPTLLDRAYTIIENRINSLGLSEPVIQKVPQYDRLIIELPGLNDVNAAKSVIGSTAKLYFNTLRDEATLAKAQKAIDAAIRGNIAKSKEELNQISDSVTVSDSTANKDTAKVEDTKKLTEEDALLAIDEDSTDADSIAEPFMNSKLFTEYAILRGNVWLVNEHNKNAVNQIINDPKVQKALKLSAPGSKFAWGYKGRDKSENNGYLTLYLLKAKPEMDGTNISDARGTLAQGGMTSGQPIVSLEFNNRGAKQFARVTRRYKGKQLAIVLDNTVYSAPNINEPITMGRAQISGHFTREEANNLAVVLQAGSLPAPATIEQVQVIGASLGHESIVTATKAAIIGFLIIMVFMMIYYKGAGVVAVIGLFLNIIFVLAIMASFGATLTLPGIAGLILTVGMSIDANVIIFERIKEELRLGKGVMSSIDAGYDRAFFTIIDANVTTLFTALILFYVGSGPIKGFALTMIFGILVSLFTALTFTKMIFHLVLSGKKNIKKLSI